MTITYPRNDVMSAQRLIVQAPGFRLFELQVISRLRSGQLRGKSFSDPIWTASFATPTITQDEAVDFEAVLNSLNGLQAFVAYDDRRPYPLAHSTGNFNDSAQINAIQNNGKTIQLYRCDPGFTVTRGDKMAVTFDGRTTLHQASETATPATGALTPTGFFDIAPNLPPGVLGGAPVTFKKPSVNMVVVPDSVSYNPAAAALATVTFQAVQD